jgi:hypothetical protein
LPRLQRPAFAALGIAAAAYAVLVAAGDQPVSRDIGYLVLFLLFAQALLFALANGRFANLQRAIAYVGAAVAVFIDHRGLGAVEPSSLPVMACFAVLAFFVVASFRLSGGRRFELTTLDLLVIFVAVVVPSLPGLFGDTKLIGAALAKVVALFYALEFLLNSPHALRTVQVALLIFPAAVALRAFAQ